MTVILSSREAAAIGIETASAMLPGGVRLEYAIQGRGPRTPVIFLHGVTDSWRSWAGVFANLPLDMPVYAPSQRGHGDSSRPAGGYRYRDMARDIAAFMDVLRLPTAIIVGHSMGAMVAQRFAIDYPERTERLVLMGGWAALHRDGAIREFVETEISKLTNPVDAGFVREFQMSTLAREVPAEVIDGAVNESLKVPARVWRDLFDGFLTEDHSSELARIAAPVLLAWGDRDRYSNRQEQDALAAAIPDTQLTVYEGGGHAFHWEAPGAFAADLEAFVA